MDTNFIFPQVCHHIRRTICCPEKKVTTTTDKPHRISDESKLLNFKFLYHWNYFNSYFNPEIY